MILRTIIGLGRDIKDLINEIIEVATEHKLKGKYVVLSLKKGRPIKGQIHSWDRVAETRFVCVKNGKENRIPVDNIACIEFFSEEPEIETRHQYGIPEMRYSLTDFPKPFIDDKGELDLMFVYGITAIDYSDYKRHMESRGETPELRAYYQRLTDLDYLLTLAIRFGHEEAMRSGGKRPGTMPTGRQDFLLTSEEKEKHNLILVGSGSCNNITKEVFESYENLPIAFDAPDSSRVIIWKKDREEEIYDRTLTGKNIGFLSMLPSPFNPAKVVLIAAGNRTTGTQAALLALCKGFEGRLHPTTESTPQLLVKAAKVEERFGKQLVTEIEVPRAVTL